MFTTAVLLMVFGIAQVTQIALWFMMLRLGTHWVKISDITTGRALFITLIVFFVQAGLGLASLSYGPKSPLDAILVTLVLVGTVIGFPVVVIRGILQASWWQAFRAWLPTLLANLFGFLLVLLAIIPRINSCLVLGGKTHTVLLPRASAHNSCLVLPLIECPSEVVLPRRGARAIARVVPIPMRLEICAFGTTRNLLWDVKTRTLSGRRGKWRCDSFASLTSLNGDHAMPLKKPLSLLVPQRVRTIPQSFAWIDHRLRSEGILPRLRPEDIGLYLFLTLAADQQGLSCWRLDRIEKTMPCFDRHALWDARSRLAQLDLIAYRPWRVGEPDGCYQVLSVQRAQELSSPELQQAMTQVLRHLEPPSTRY